MIDNHTLPNGVYCSVGHSHAVAQPSHSPPVKADLSIDAINLNIPEAWFTRYQDDQSKTVSMFRELSVRLARLEDRDKIEDSFLVMAKEVANRLADAPVVTVEPPAVQVAAPVVNVQTEIPMLLFMLLGLSLVSWSALGVWVLMR